LKISDIHVTGESEDMSAKERLLLWSQQTTEGYAGIRCENFTTCWRDGRLFNAIIHKYRPDLIDMNTVAVQSNLANLEHAFFVAEKLGVARLLDPEDVDVSSPDEKSVITYVSSLYDAFPKVPEGGEGISANDVEVKWVEYQNMVNYLMQWIRHHVTIMSDRAFPNNPVELKALYNQYLQFKETEIPPKETEKSKIKRLYKLLEVWIEFGRIKLPQGYHPNDIEKEWGKLIIAMLEREKTLRPEVERLEMLQQIANRIQRDSRSCEDKLILARNALQSDTKRLESGLQFQHEAEIAGYLLESENLLRQQVIDAQILIDGKYYQADQLVQRVAKLRDELMAIRTECSSVYNKGHALTTEQTKLMISGITESLNSGFTANLTPELNAAMTQGLTPALTSSSLTSGLSSGLTSRLTPTITPTYTPGIPPRLIQSYVTGVDSGTLQTLKLMQIRKPLMKSAFVDQNLTEEEVNMKFVQDLLNWVEEMQVQLDRAEWGSDLPSVESHLENHKNVHKAIEEFESSLKEAKISEIQMTAPLKLSYAEKLHKLESQYSKLLNTSRNQERHLDTLHNFVSRATRELIWLNEKEEEEVAYDWSERNPNITRKKEYHAELMRELDQKEVVIKSVQEIAEQLLLENHPARLTIEAYRAAMQTQWSWILQLCHCVEQHLRENAAYFEFFSDAKEAMEYLKNLKDTIYRKYNCDRSSSLHRLEDLVQESMEEKEQLLQYKSTVAGLVGRAKAIIQLKPRNSECILKTSIPIKAICDYRQIEITIYKDDECVLANNSHRAKWKVISPSGNEAMVPSVCFSVPPPNKEAIDTANRIEQQFQNVLALWHESHVNMKSVVSWHYLTNEIEAVRAGNVASIKTMLPGEHQQVLSNLQSRFDDFVEDSRESKIFTSSDTAQLEREVNVCKQYYQELLKSAEREEQEESIYNLYISEVRNIRLQLESCEERLIRQIRTPMERDDLHESVFRISEQEKLKKELDRLKDDLGVITDKCEEFFSQAAGSPSVPTLRSELNLVIQNMNQVYSMSSIYIDKLKTVNLVLKNTQGAESLVKLYETKLCEEEAVTADKNNIENLMGTLKQWRSEVDEKRQVFHALEDELQKAKMISDQMFKMHKERDLDFDWHKEKVDQLAERWQNIHCQIENRLRDLEGINKSLKYYKDTYNSLDTWIQQVEDAQRKIQEIRPENSKALAKQLNQHKMLVSEIEMKQGKIDECQKYSEQYSAAVKDYELQTMTYRAMVDSQQKSPVKRRRMQSSSDFIIQEFMDLRTRYTALVTLMTQYIKFAGDSLKRLEEEEVGHPLAVSQAKRTARQTKSNIPELPKVREAAEKEWKKQQKDMEEICLQKTKAEQEAKQCLAVQLGLLNNTILKFLHEPSSNAKCFHNPNNRKAMYYCDLLKMCLFSVSSKCFLLPVGERKISSPSVNKVIAGVIDQTTGEVLSVFQSILKGFIDYDTGIRLLENQLILSGIISPELGVCYDLEEAKAHALIDEQTLLQLQELSNAKKLISESSLSNLPVVSALEQSLISEPLAIKILENQLSSGHLILPSTGENLTLQNAFQRNLISPTLYTKLLERQDTCKDLIDPNCAEKISLEQIVHRSVIHEETGLRLLPVKPQEKGRITLKCGRKVTILRAAHEGLIDRETMFRLLGAQLMSGGIIDPDSGKRITVEEAMRQGMIDQDTACGILTHQVQTGGILCPNSGKRLTVDEAVQCNLISSTSALLVLEAQRGFVGLIWPHTGEIFPISTSLHQEMITNELAFKILNDRQKIAALYIPETCEIVSLDKAAQSGMIDINTVSVLTNVTLPDKMPNVGELEFPCKNAAKWLSMYELLPSAFHDCEEEHEDSGTEGPVCHNLDQAKKLFISYLMVNSYMDANTGGRLLLYDGQLQEAINMLLEGDGAAYDANVSEMEFNKKYISLKGINLKSAGSVHFNKVTGSGQGDLSVYQFGKPFCTVKTHFQVNGVQQCLKLTEKMQGHLAVLQDIKSHLDNQQPISNNLEILKDQLEQLESFESGLATFTIILKKDMKLTEEFFKFCNRDIPEEKLKELKISYYYLQEAFSVVCDASSNRAKQIVCALDSEMSKLAVLHQQLLSKLQRFSDWITEYSKIVNDFTVNTNDIEEMKKSLQLFKNSSAELSCKKMQLESTAFDVQFFISEHAQDLSPNQSKQLLRLLNTTQKSFQEVQEALISQVESSETQLQAAQELGDQKDVAERQQECKEKLQEICDLLTQTENRLIGQQESLVIGDSKAELEQYQTKQEEIQKDMRMSAQTLAEIVKNTENFLKENGEKLSQEDKTILEQKLNEAKTKCLVLSQKAEESKKELDRAMTTAIKQETEKVAAIEQLEESKNTIENLLDWLSNVDKEAEHSRKFKQAIEQNGTHFEEGDLKALEGDEDDVNGNLLEIQQDIETQVDGLVKSTEDNLNQQYQKVKAQHEKIISQQQAVIIATQSAQALLEKQGHYLSPEEKDKMQRNMKELKAQYETALAESERKMKLTHSLREELEKFEADYSEFETWLQQAEQELDNLEAGASDFSGVMVKLKRQKSFSEDVISHKGDLRYITISGQRVLDAARSCSKRDGVKVDKDGVDTSATYAEVQSKLDSASDRFKSLYTKCSILGNNLKDLVDKYQHYEDASSGLLSGLQASEIAVNKQLSEPIAVDPKNLQRQLEETKVLQGQVSNHQIAVEKLKKAAEVLLDTRGELTQDKDEIQKTLDDIVERYDNLSKSVNERNEKLQITLTRSLSVQDGLDEMLDWMEGVEKSLEEQDQVPLNSAAIQDIISKSIMLEQDIMGRQSSINTMNEKVKKFTETADPSTASTLQAKMSELAGRFSKAGNKHKEKLMKMEELKTKVELFEGLSEKLQSFLDEKNQAFSETEAPRKDVSEVSQYIQEASVELAQHKKDLEVLQQLLEELSFHALPGDKALVLEKVNALSKKFREVEETVKEKEEDVSSCQKQMDTFELLVESLKKWIKETTERIPAAQPSLNTEELKKPLEDTLNLKDEWTLKAPELQKMNSQGTLLCNLITAVTSPAKLRAVAKSGGTMLNGEGGPPGIQDFLKNKELTTVQQAMSDVNHSYEDLGVLLKEKISELESMLSKMQNIQEESTSMMQWLQKMDKTASDWEAAPTDSEAVKAQVEQHKLFETELKQSANKVQELKDKVTELLEKNPDSPEAPKWRQMLDKIDSKWKELNQVTSERQQKLEESSNYLTQFQTAEAQLKHWLVEKELMVSVLGPLSIDPNMLNTQKQQVQILLKEFDTRKPQYEQLTMAGEGILMRPGEHPPSHEIVKEQLAAVAQKWDSLTGQLRNRCDRIDQAIVKSTEYQSLLRSLSDKLHAWDSKLSGSQAVSTQPDAVKQQLEIAREMKEEIEQETKNINAAQALCEELSVLVGEEYLKAELTRQLDGILKLFKDIEQKSDNHVQQLQSAYATSHQFQQMSKDFQAWLGKKKEELNQARPVSAKLDALQSLIEEQKDFKKTMTDQICSYERIVAEGESILQKTQGADKAALQSQIATLRSNWDEMNKQVKERQDKLTDCLEKALKYKQHVENLQPWIEKCQSNLCELKVGINPVEIENSIVQVRAWQKDLDKHHGMVELLNNTAESLLSASQTDKEIVLEETKVLNQKVYVVTEQLHKKRECLENMAQRLKQFQESSRETERQLKSAREHLEAHDSLGPQSFSNKHLTMMQAQQKALQALRPHVDLAKKLAQDLVIEASDSAGVSDLLLQAESLEREYTAVNQQVEDRCSFLETKLQGIGHFQNSIREMFSQFAEFDDELDSMAPVGRDLKILQSQREDIKGFLKKLEDLIMNNENANKNCKIMLATEAEASPDLVGIKRDLEALNKQCNKLLDRAKAREDQVEGTFSRVEDFYSKLKEFSSLLGRAEEHEESQGPVGMETETINQQLNTFKWLSSDLGGVLFHSSQFYLYAFICFKWGIFSCSREAFLCYGLADIDNFASQLTVPAPQFPLLLSSISCFLMRSVYLFCF
uniref:Dystonin n=1 Tax=Accipiter nisus TaxID=211598 RepID=A0A8B9NMA3_9AVES